MKTQGREKRKKNDVRNWNRKPPSSLAPSCGVTVSARASYPLFKLVS